MLESCSDLLRLAKETSPRVWEVAVKQVEITQITHIAFCLFSFLTIIIICRSIKKCIRKFKIEDKLEQINKDNDSTLWAAFIAVFAALLICDTVIFIYHAINILQCYFNPDFCAMQLLLSLI